MKLGILTSWGATCGVAEMGSMLVEAFVDKGIPCFVFGNTFDQAQDYYEVFVQVNVPVLRCFSTGFTPANYRAFDVGIILQTVRSEKITHFVINYQDFLLPCKTELNLLLEELAKQSIPVYAILHDTCLDSTVRWDLIQRIAPPSFAQLASSPEAVIDQGIPELQLANYDQQDSIGCFGLGRNKTYELLEVIQELRAELDRPILSTVVVPKPSQFPEVDGWKLKFAGLQAHYGYHSRNVLGSILNRCKAVVVWYPDLRDVSNSSAFRFAIGSKVPILAVRNNWITNYVTSGVFLPMKDSKASVKETLKKLLQDETTYKFYREMLGLHQEQAIQVSGWSQIADQYEELFARQSLPL